MSCYDQAIKINATFQEEARSFLGFLQRVGSKYPRPTRIKYRYLKRGRFSIIIDGNPGHIDALFQELIINRGLYYYCCTLANKQTVINEVILPIFRQLVDSWFQNPQSRFLRKHMLGKYAQTDFIPTEFNNPHSQAFEILFRRWDLGLVSNKEMLSNLDSLLTQFLLERSGHVKGERSPKFKTLLSSFGNRCVLDKEYRKEFERIHKASRSALHRLSKTEAHDELYRRMMTLYRYFQYLDEYDEPQEWKTEICDGKRYRRVRFGKERTHVINGIEMSWAPLADKGPCGDCAVLKGELHVSGCDIEECPKCGGQFISCNCKREY